MSNVPQLHKVSDLPKLSLVYLRSALNNPGWTSGISDYITGGNAVMKVPVHSIPPALSHDEAIFEWGKVVDPTVIEFTEKERDVIKVAIKHAVSQKTIAVNPYTLRLFSTFGLE